MPQSRVPKGWQLHEISHLRLGKEERLAYFVENLDNLEVFRVTLYVDQFRKSK